MSWIHLDDVLRLIDRTIDEPTMQGVYNAVAPNPIKQANFAVTAGKVLNRPVFLRVPAAPLRGLTGEMGQLFLDGQRVVPARLEAEGYVFSYPTLASALGEVIESAAKRR
jgi:NAD dependent epimerase/dehydratase family enzyme